MPAVRLLDIWLALLRRFWGANVDALESYLDRMGRIRMKARGTQTVRDKGKPRKR